MIAEVLMAPSARNFRDHENAFSAVGAQGVRVTRR